MISGQLLNSTFNYFNKQQNDEVVVKPSLPILYFGDLEGYAKSGLKVITVGKNPSLNEFRLQKQEDYSFVRFAKWDAAKKNLTEALNQYFKADAYPFKQWFASFEPILNGLNTSYYGGIKENIALHTDLCSPLATNPTWSKLSDEKKASLFEGGLALWKQLIEELQPDVLLVSVPRELFNQVFKTKGSELIVFTTKKDGRPRKSSYSVEIHKYQLESNKSVTVLFGQPANKPFDTISAEQKIKIGEICPR